MRKMLGLGLVILVFVLGISIFSFRVNQRPEDWPRTVTVWNLKMLALAMHEYHDKHGRLPPAAVFDQEGTSLLSWRVLLLPYIEQDELFGQFKIDESWDSPHNLKLLPKMPSTYAPAYGSPPHEPYTTFYQVFVGKGTAFEGYLGLRFTDFGARMSNTFLIVEAGNAVPWTKPEDLPFDMSKPLPKLGGLRNSIFLATFMDGSARTVPQKTKESTLRAAIVRTGPGPGDAGDDW